MSVWIIRPPVDEAKLEEMIADGELVLPLDETLPDLTQINSQAALKKTLLTLMPDAAPETMSRQMERIWPLLMQIQPEDAIAMFLPLTRRVAVGEVTGGVEFKDGMHHIPVAWGGKRYTLVQFGKYRDLFDVTRPNYFEVSHANPKRLIRIKLPHRFNRFAKWQWLLVVLIGMRLVHMAIRFWHLEFGR